MNKIGRCYLLLALFTITEICPATAETYVSELVDEGDFAGTVYVWNREDESTAVVPEDAPLYGLTEVGIAVRLRIMTPGIDVRDTVELAQHTRLHAADFVKWPICASNNCWRLRDHRGDSISTAQLISIVASSLAECGVKVVGAEMPESPSASGDPQIRIAVSIIASDCSPAYTFSIQIGLDGNICLWNRDGIPFRGSVYREECMGAADELSEIAENITGAMARFAESVVRSNENWDGNVWYQRPDDD
ncbi:MAG: hypothetical protein KKG33_10375 [candidate division Zixibacteria bacterium]|nr:hypothetical protein [candidate division Zixibacteria bacterium]MBU1470192.1 hypothetical protein [candidate division Zixibacteria bacterium]MBU2625953.1 hypothetical protein [candidate division Zixibacteria bacterium]